MSQRALITFPDSQYSHLRELSNRTGTPIAELVRRAIKKTYPSRDEEKEQRLALAKEGAGIWADRSEDPFDELRGMWPVPKEW